MDRAFAPSTSKVGVCANSGAPRGCRHASKANSAHQRIRTAAAAERVNGAATNGSNGASGPLSAEELKKHQRRGAILGKSGAELREEFFLAASTGMERGLPEGAFLNDNTTGDEPQVELTFQPWGGTVKASEGSSLLKAGVEAGAFEIGPEFCLTGQCDSCLVETDTGEAILACMNAVPKGREKMGLTVVASDEAWDAMCAGEPESEAEQEDADFMFV